MLVICVFQNFLKISFKPTHVSETFCQKKDKQTAAVTWHNLLITSMWQLAFVCPSVCSQNNSELWMDLNEIFRKCWPWAKAQTLPGSTGTLTFDLPKPGGFDHKASAWWRSVLSEFISGLCELTACSCHGDQYQKHWTNIIAKSAKMSRFIIFRLWINHINHVNSMTFSISNHFKSKNNLIATKNERKS